MQLLAHESPKINGDGTNSRDFTYIDNVIQMNHLAALTTNPEARGQIFNTAVGERADLNRMVYLLKKHLSEYDSEISKIDVLFGEERLGDIPHSLACIEKSETLLGYRPTHNLENGLKESVDWYMKNLK